MSPLWTLWWCSKCVLTLRYYSVGIEDSVVIYFWSGSLDLILIGRRRPASISWVIYFSLARLWLTIPRCWKISLLDFEYVLQYSSTIFCFLLSFMLELSAFSRELGAFSRGLGAFLRQRMVQKLLSRMNSGALRPSEIHSSTISLVPVPSRSTYPARYRGFASTGLLGIEVCGRDSCSVVSPNGSRPGFQTSSLSGKSIIWTLPLLV